MLSKIIAYFYLTIFSIITIGASNQVHAISEEGKVLTPLFTAISFDIAQVLDGLVKSDFNESDPSVVGAKASFQTNLDAIAAQFRNFLKPKDVKAVVTFYNALLSNSIGLTQVYSILPVNQEQVEFYREQFNEATRTFYAALRPLIVDEGKQEKFLKLLESLKIGLERQAKLTANAQIAPTESNYQTLNNTKANVSIISANLGLASSKLASSRPIITSITPNAGPYTGGNTVTIRGDHFNGLEYVEFGFSHIYPTVILVSPQEIKVIVPAFPSAGPTRVLVVTDHGSAETTYTFQNLAPVITKISPNNGPQSGGTEVIITGKNFFNHYSVIKDVYFDHTKVPFTRINPETLSVISPPGNGTVVISLVTTDGIISERTVADRFKYNP